MAVPKTLDFIIRHIGFSKLKFYLLFIYSFAILTTQILQ